MSTESAENTTESGNSTMVGIPNMSALNGMRAHEQMMRNGYAESKVRLMLKKSEAGAHTIQVVTSTILRISLRRYI